MSRGGWMRGWKKVEERWGYPFWNIVWDFAEQGFNRKQTAQALGYSRDAFVHMLRDHPALDPFQSPLVALTYMLDTGEGFRAALERMARQHYTLIEASREIGYSHPKSLQWAMRSRGIDVKFKRLDLIAQYERKRGKPLAALLKSMVDRGLSRNAAAREIGLKSGSALAYQMKVRGIELTFKQTDAVAEYQEKTGKELGSALAEMAKKGYSRAAAAREIGMGSGLSLAYQIKVRGINVVFDRYRPSKRDHPWRKESEVSYQAHAARKRKAN